MYAVLQKSYSAVPHRPPTLEVCLEAAMAEEAVALEGGDEAWCSRKATVALDGGGGAGVQKVMEMYWK